VEANVSPEKSTYSLGKKGDSGRVEIAAQFVVFAEGEKEEVGIGGVKWIFMSLNFLINFVFFPQNCVFYFKNQIRCVCMSVSSK
jgi:hypothetical protein